MRHVPTPAELEDEARRARWVQRIVDLVSAVIMQGQLTRAEGESLVTAARARILELFPGRDETYELIYSRRFDRLLVEFTRPDTSAVAAGGVLLPFAPRHPRG